MAAMSEQDDSRPGLASKDFSSFATNQTKIEAHNARNEDSKRVKMSKHNTLT